jgi:hypothetical protein
MSRLGSACCALTIFAISLSATGLAASMYVESGVGRGDDAGAVVGWVGRVGALDDVAESDDIDGAGAPLGTSLGGVGGSARWLAGGGGGDGARDVGSVCAGVALPVADVTVGAVAAATLLSSASSPSSPSLSSPSSSSSSSSSPSMAILFS